MSPQERLVEFFKTFQRDEPFALTKNRRDLVKGFRDTSEEGNDLSELIRMRNDKDPRDSFYLFDDGFHTPAPKQPSHPSFILNDPRKQAMAMARFPNQQRPAPTNRGIVEQLLEIIGARK